MSAITDEKCQRLFFALWPDEVVRQELVRLSRQLTVPPEAKRVPPENLHLTLAFIGSQGQEVQECLEQQAAAIDLPPFTLTFDQLGFFAKPQVVWLGDKNPPESLLQLAQALSGVPMPREAKVIGVRCLQRGKGGVSYQLCC